MFEQIRTTDVNVELHPGCESLFLCLNRSELVLMRMAELEHTHPACESL